MALTISLIIISLLLFAVFLLSYLGDNDGESTGGIFLLLLVVILVTGVTYTEKPQKDYQIDIIESNKKDFAVVYDGEKIIGTVNISNTKLDSLIRKN